MPIAFRGCLRPFQVGGREEHRQQVIAALEKADEFFSYFEGKRIYFDTQLCALIDAMDVAFRRASAALSPLFHGDQPLGETWNDAWKEFMATVPPLRGEIETRARDMLGVSKSARGISKNA